MRWDSLFDDLESQLERELLAQDDDLEREDERARLARLGLRDRFVAWGRHTVTVQLTGGARHPVTVTDVGRDWLAVESAGTPSWSGVIPLAAVASVAVRPDVVRATLPEAGVRHPLLAERLGLPIVLRDLCRRRRYVALDLDAGVLSGTIDRVGADHLDLAVHPSDAPRRESSVSEVRIVPFDALRVVRLR